MDLIEFYTKAIKSVGLTLDEDNFICLKENDKLERVMHNKKQIFMPTYENLKKVNDNIIIFNPLEEDSIRGINPSMVKYKSILDRRLAQSFNVVLELISMLGADLELQKKASLELNKFLSSLAVLRKQNMKNIVDDAFVSLVRKIIAISLTKSAHSGSVFIKTDKGKVIDGEKFNKVANLSLPIYEDLKENNEAIFEIELKRKKDAGIYSIITEFIIGTKDNSESIDYDKYAAGSNHLESPTFIVVYKLYYKLAKRFNSLLKSLSFINKDIATSAMINLELELDDLVEINNFIGELKLIPNLNSGTNITKKIDAAPVVQNVIPRLPNGRPTMIVEEQPVVNTRPIGAGALLRTSNGRVDEFIQPVVNTMDRPRMNIGNPNMNMGRPMMMQRPTMQPNMNRGGYGNREYSPFSRTGGFGF